jgi:hypothetical protein
VCKDNFIEVKDIELPSNENIKDYKVIFKADDVKKIDKLLNLIDQEQKNNEDTDRYFINYRKDGFYEIPFYAVLQKDREFQLLKVKNPDIKKTNVSNYTVEIIQDPEPKSSGTENEIPKSSGTVNEIPKSSVKYDTQKLYLLKTDIDTLEKILISKPPTKSAGGRKSRRTINRKRRAVRKRRNTKRHSKTYRR